jgi:hypothetical protein
MEIEGTAMRIILIASLIAALSGAAYAADDSLDKAAKKTSDGFGNLLNAMGQEVKKTGIGDDKKNDEKKAAKSSAKADPNPKGDRK